MLLARLDLTSIAPLEDIVVGSESCRVFGTELCGLDFTSAREDFLLRNEDVNLRMPSISSFLSLKSWVSGLFRFRLRLSYADVSVCWGKAVAKLAKSHFEQKHDRGVRQVTGGRATLVASHVPYCL